MDHDEKTRLEQKVISLRSQLADARRELMLKHDRAMAAELKADRYFIELMKWDSSPTGRIN